MTDSPENVDNQPTQLPPPPVPPGPAVGLLTDIGRVRTENQDTVFATCTVLEFAGTVETAGLYIVADGMGGHKQGAQASQAAVRAAAAHILQNIYLPELYHNPAEPAAPPLNELLVQAVETANTAVRKAAPEGGTTLTAVVMLGHSAYIAHVGDSRAYLFKEGVLKQITTDHSLARRMEELGHVSSGKPAESRNVLYRALGQSDTVEVDIHFQNIPHAASLVLCSDGLWGAVHQPDMEAILQQAATPQEACQRLVNKANENGGEDNISVIIVTMGEGAPSTG